MVVALAPGDAPGTLDLNKLFIEPLHLRGSVGHALLAHAVARRGAAALRRSGKSRRASGSPPDKMKLVFLRHPARRARIVPDNRFTWIEITAKSRGSLISRINSLMTRFNSLLGQNKFPVPRRRELARK